jgi:hypothetical protein
LRDLGEPIAEPCVNFERNEALEGSDLSRLERVLFMKEILDVWESMVNGNISDVNP